MNRKHERRARSDRVAEPVQVYLDQPDRERLQRLAVQFDTTKSDILRRGLDALESLTRRPATRRVKTMALPTFAGQGLQPGVDLDDTASLLDLMGRDASG